MNKVEKREEEEDKGVHLLLVGGCGRWLVGWRDRVR